MKRAILAALLLCLGCSQTLVSNPMPTPQRPPTVGEQLLEAHNAVRRSHGKLELQADPVLMRQAEGWAARMASTGQFHHSHYGAENIGWNYRDVPAVMHGWLWSPGHRANILGRYTRFGGGVARDAGGHPYWCTRFE